MYKIQEYVDIKEYSTLHVGGVFHYFVIISSIEDLISFFSFIKKDEKYKNIPVFILGGGSNVVFSDGILEVIAAKIEIKGFEVIKEDNNYVDIKVGAGEIWDNFVSQTVNMGLSGVEALSSIPGTVGAGPVQNIGAYGSEVKDTIQEVEVFDIHSGTINKILNKDCKFGYRDSIFKNEAKGKYVITAVVYRLIKYIPDAKLSPALSYPGVLSYFEEREIVDPSLVQIRDAIIYIRGEKLPNPRDIPNVGSFFKNPIVSNDIAGKIKEEFSNVKLFPIDNNFTKVPAGWLIENAGLKGKSIGKVSIYTKNALVLVNTENATCEDMVKARDEIIRIVNEKFGITLEQEPEII